MTIKWNPEKWEPKKKPNAKEMPTHCKYGHPWSKQNTGYYFHKGRGIPGKKYRVCKACRANQWRLKYATDSVFRNQHIKNNLDRYHKKASHGLDKIS